MAQTPIQTQSQSQTPIQTPPQPQLLPEINEEEDVFQDSMMEIPQDVYDFEPSIENIERVRIGDNSYPVFNVSQEEEYSTLLNQKDPQKYKRRETIKKQIREQSNYNPNMSSMKDKKLLGYLYIHRRDLYNKALNS